MTLPVSEIFEKCQQRFPTVRLPFEVFEERINEILSSELHLTADEAKTEALAKLHHEDIYLATACVHDDRIAWEHFADDYLPLLRQYAAQAGGNPGDAEDLAHEITARLLKDKDRLAGYNGRGSLAGWLRVAVSHAAIDRFRRMNRLTSFEDLKEASAPTTPRNPERNKEEEALDSRWGPIFTVIAAECLRGLPARDRLLLCLYYLQGISLKDIGLQFGIHEATVSRWLEKTRRDTRKHVERELRKKHGLRSSEINSLWRFASPGALAESVAGSFQQSGSPQRNPGGQVQKKTAIDENSGVIEKEELR